MKGVCSRSVINQFKTGVDAASDIQTEPRHMRVLGLCYIYWKVQPRPAQNYSK